MNLPESGRLQPIDVHPVQENRPKPTGWAAKRRSDRKEAIAAGAAAFLLTSVLMLIQRRSRQERMAGRERCAAKLAELAEAADHIAALLRRGPSSVDRSGSRERYPATLPLELERAQHRLAGAYGSLYRMLGASEQSGLLAPEKFPFLQGIAAHEQMRTAVPQSAADKARDAALNRLLPGWSDRSEARFIPDRDQRATLEELDALCADLSELIRGGAGRLPIGLRPERAIRKLLAAIQKRRQERQYPDRNPG
ncbi:hypothetical protein [Saccharibacillus qingshengii]|uniref:hypothetical protein n=1 Tax=Saccharibacillus qingshengii TaxID=1763540 RepID=UPI001558117C|nr:hypothetical protein [Saccharibacillus qingshengii]